MTRTLVVAVGRIGTGARTDTVLSPSVRLGRRRCTNDAKGPSNLRSRMGEHLREALYRTTDREPGYRAVLDRQSAHPRRASEGGKSAAIRQTGDLRR